MRISFQFGTETKTGTLIKKGFICGNFMYTVLVDGQDSPCNLYLSEYTIIEDEIEPEDVIKDVEYQVVLNKAVELLEGNNTPYDFVCPHCLTINNMNNDGYQMNDIVETVFCSYDCSHQFNIDHKAEFIKQGYSETDLKDLA